MSGADQHHHTPERAEAVEYLPFVRKVAQRIARRLPQSVDIEDLVGAGTVGLLEAMDRYDPKGGRSFETYAEFRVKGAIIDDLRRADPLKRTSRALSNRLASKHAELATALGREPTRDELAAALDVAVAEVEDQLVCSQSTQNQLVWDEERPIAAQEPSQEERIAQRERIIAVRGAIDKLSDRQQILLDLYYVEEVSQQEIGEILGVTESRVCQLLSEVRTKLKRALRAVSEEADG